MSDKHRIHAWLDVKDGPLDLDQARLRLIRALHRIGDVPVNVLCEGPIREDTAR